jgi:F-type H+-transporting ATPase subunit epsilon
MHTPYRPFFIGMVESVVLTLVDGEIGIYAHHAPFTAPSVSCVLRIKDDKGVIRQAFIAEGILEVKDHKDVLMVDAAEWPDEIDPERARASMQKAEESLNSSPGTFEVARVKTKLRRAEFRLKVLKMKKILL